MTIEQRTGVDFVSIDREGNAVLTISDHLPWDDVNAHLFSLQEKLTAYLRFVESGEIYEKCAVAKERPIIISVTLKFEQPNEAQWFFTKTAAAIEKAGFRFEVRQFSV